jgi:hypothetical protein
VGLVSWRGTALILSGLLWWWLTTVGAQLIDSANVRVGHVLIGLAFLSVGSALVLYRLTAYRWSWS